MSDLTTSTSADGSYNDLREMSIYYEETTRSKNAIICPNNSCNLLEKNALRQSRIKPKPKLFDVVNTQGSQYMDGLKVSELLESILIGIQDGIGDFISSDRE
jgi:hypothetical protein